MPIMRGTEKQSLTCGCNDAANNRSSDLGRGVREELRVCDGQQPVKQLRDAPWRHIAHLQSIRPPHSSVSNFS